MESRNNGDFVKQEQFTFLPGYYSELVRLKEFTRLRNEANYQEPQFTFLAYPELDKHLVITEVPDLGRGQLGVFAGKDYEIGERIAVYDGTHLSEKKDATEVKATCENFKGPGDYIWQAPCDEKDSIAVDGRLKGTTGRYVNHSENHNAELRYIDGVLYYVAVKRIPAGKEITTSYGKSYFEGLANYVEREPADLTKLFGNFLLDKNFILPQVEKLIKKSGVNIDEKNTHDPNIVMLDLVDKNSNYKLFFNDNDDVLVFPIASEQQSQSNPILNAVVGKEITFTAQSNLVIAPLLIAPDGLRKFGLFTAIAMPSGTKVCEIKGEEILKQRGKKIDPGKEFIEFKTKYVCFDRKASEAHFLQGANVSDANVIIKKEFIYTIKDLKPGELLLAYYGPQYHQLYFPYQLNDLFFRVNVAQNKPSIAFFEQNNRMHVMKLNVQNQHKQIEYSAEKENQPWYLDLNGSSSTPDPDSGESPLKRKKVQGLQIVKVEGTHITLKKVIQ